MVSRPVDAVAVADREVLGAVAAGVRDDAFRTEAQLLGRRDPRLDAERIGLPARVVDLGNSGGGTLKGPAGKVYEYYRRHEAAPLEPELFDVF